MKKLRLVSELARKILGEVKTLTTENIIIVNQEGIIIASTDKSRVGVAHEGAQHVMYTRKKLYITREMATELAGVKPGINLPIFFGKEVIGVIGITGIPDDVEPFAELIRRMTELMIREAYYTEKKEWETRGLESFFNEWIYITDIDDHLLHRGEILGIPFDIPYQCMLIQLDSTFISRDLIQVQNDMYHWFDQEFSRNQNDFLVRWGNERFLLIKSDEYKMSNEKLMYKLASWQKYFQDKYHITLAFGVGKTIEKRRISKSYHEAKKALNLAEKDYRIVFYESLLLDIMLAEVTNPTKDEYLDRIFSSIKRERELIETLRLYLKNNLSLKKSASELHIHINTLHYRLNQIKELTGIDPKNSAGIALFYIALELMDKGY